MATFSQTSYQRVGEDDFNDPTCVMWATLGLAWLSKSALDPQNEELHHPWFTFALDTTLFSFAPLQSEMDFAWSTNEYRDLAAHMLSQWRKVLTPMYGEAITTVDYFVHLFKSFHKLESLPPQGPLDKFSAWGIASALPKLMRDLLEGTIRNGFGQLNNTLASRWVNPEAAREVLCNIHADVATSVWGNLEKYLLAKLDERRFGGQAFQESFGQAMLKLLQPELRKHVYDCVSKFMETIFTLRMRIDPSNLSLGDDGQIVRKNSFTHMDEESVTDWRLKHFFCNLARLFSYRSPILSSLLSTSQLLSESDDDADYGSDDSDHQLPEHVVNHDFEQYRR